MIDNDTMRTIRRRIADKMCKDDDFLRIMAAVAVEEGSIKYIDILNTTQTKEILGLEVKQ